MSDPVPLRLNGVHLLADLSGALYWPARRLLAVADLHLEKGSGFASRGRLLPPYDSAATLARLADAVDRHRPETVVCLGDSFHDRRGAERLGSSDGARLTALMQGRHWIWIVGNHDPAPPDSLGGIVRPEFASDRLIFRHIAEPSAAPGEVSGHFHPKAIFSWRGRILGGRCFIGDDLRLMLPAFGAYAGGLDVRDPAIARLFGRGTQIHILGRRQLHSFPARQLVGTA